MNNIKKPPFKQHLISPSKVLYNLYNGVEYLTLDCTLLNNGAYSKIYLINECTKKEYEGKILKVCNMENDGYHFITLLTNKQIKEFCLPIIYDWFYDFLENSDHSVLFVIMEKLNEYAPLYNLKEIEYPFEELNTKRKFIDSGNNELNFIIERYLDLFTYVENNIFEVKGDLNENNIMMRDNGELVITDPFTRDYFVQGI